MTDETEKAERAARTLDMRQVIATFLPQAKSLVKEGRHPYNVAMPLSLVVADLLAVVAVQDEADKPSHTAEQHFEALLGEIADFMRRHATASIDLYRTALANAVAAQQSKETSNAV